MALTIPLETEIPIPYGFPMAKTLSPIFRLSLFETLIGFSSLFELILRTAMSAFTSSPIRFASNSSPL